MMKGIIIAGMMALLMGMPGIACAERFDDMADISGWKTEAEAGAQVTLKSEPGVLGLDYTFSAGRWAQAKKEVKLGFNSDFVFKFKFKGTGSANNIHIKLEDQDGDNFGYELPSLTPGGAWKEYEIPLKQFKYFWGGNGTMDWANVRKIYLAVARTAGGGGSVWFDEFATEKVTMAAPPSQKEYTYVTGDPDRAKLAAKWILSMQQPNGLVQSYEYEETPFAWPYDQALCLIVLAHEYPSAARKLLEVLRKLQKPEGYWSDGLMLDVGRSIELSEEDKQKWIKSEVAGVQYEMVGSAAWVGSVAWIIHAIDRYAHITGDHSYDDMVKKGAAWLVTQQQADGRLHVSTEGNLDCWWALRAGGNFAEAEKLKQYLLTKVWDDQEGRFIVGLDNPAVYLDPQTWGASFCVDAGVPEKGLRALAFAKKYLACKTLDRLTKGFDTTGPYTVWNEGTLQYVVAGGEDAHLYLAAMNNLQRQDGALQHSHEEYSAGGAWHTAMYGVCPTAWLYFANTGTEPFPRKP